MTKNQSPKCEKCGFEADVTVDGHPLCSTHQTLRSGVKVFLYEVRTDFPDITGCLGS